MLVQLLHVKETVAIELGFFYYLEGKVITRAIVLLIPMKAKTKHITSKEDFMGVLPVVSFEGYSSILTFFGNGFWAGRKISCNFSLNIAYSGRVKESGDF